MIPMPTKPLYPWSEAPDFANYAATDRNGISYWFKHEPRREKYFWEIAGENDRTCVIHPNPHVTKPWDQSLEARPT